MKKKALLSSVLTIVLCLSLIAGSTFALFTSESTVNVAVTSGKVNVIATVVDVKHGSTLGENLAETSFEFGDNTVAIDKIVPGDYVTITLNVHNDSNVTVQYRTVVEKLEGDKLWKGLEVEIDEVPFTGEKTVKSDWVEMKPNCVDKTVVITVTLPEDAGNEYQDQKCAFRYVVEAVQGNAEITQEWDGETTTPITKSEDGKYHITTASELVWLMNNTQNTNSAYLNETIVLDNSIDLCGYTVQGIGSENCNFAGSFDGQGHTISNFVIERSDKDTYAGLFNYVTHGTISNLTVANATINGGETQVGALVGGMNDNATVKDCSVVGCTVIANRKVGGAVGYVAGATVENVTVKDTTIYVESTDAEQYGRVVGFVNTGAVVTNPSDENVTIIFMARVNTLDAFTDAVNNAQISKIVLTGDITNEIVPLNAGQMGYTYTIKNRDLTIDLAGHTFTSAVDLFSVEFEKATLSLESSKPNGKILFNKTYDNGRYAKMASGIRVYAKGTLNIGDNVILEANVYVGGVVSTAQNGSTINMNGGEIIVYNSYAHNATSGTFNMNGGKITLKSITEDGFATAFYLSGTVLNLNGGTVEGTGYVYEEFLGFTINQDENSSFTHNTTKGLKATN